jgi:hypothetical protein
VASLSPGRGVDRVPSQAFTKEVYAWEAPGTNGSWHAGSKGSYSQASSASQMHPTLWEAETVQTETRLSDEEHADAIDDILVQVQQVLRVFARTVDREHILL